MCLSFVLEYCLRHCAIASFTLPLCSGYHEWQTPKAKTSLPNLPSPDCNNMVTVGRLQPIIVGLAELVNVPCLQPCVDTRESGNVPSTAPAQHRCECQRPITSSPSYPSSQASRPSFHRSRWRRPRVWCRSGGCSKRSVSGVCSWNNRWETYRSGTSGVSLGPCSGMMFLRNGIDFCFGKLLVSNLLVLIC